MGDFLPRIHHDRMRSVHELIETKFVKKMVSLLSVSLKDGGFLSLEWSFVRSYRSRVLWKLWWGSWRWCWRRRSSKRFLRRFWVRRCRSKLTLCRERPREFATYRRRRLRRSCRRCWGRNSSDLASRLIIGSFQVIVNVCNSFQLFLNVIDWAGLSWR